MAIIDDFGDIARRQADLGQRDYDGAPDRSQPTAPPYCGYCWDHGWQWSEWDNAWSQCGYCNNKPERDKPPYNPTGID